jgi:hypothetical protein
VEVVPIILSLKNSALRSMSEGAEPVIRNSGQYGAAAYSAAAAAGKDVVPATYDNGKYGQITFNESQATTPLLMQQNVLREAALQHAHSPHAHLHQQDEYQRLFRDTNSSGSRSFVSANDQRQSESVAESVTDVGSPSSSVTSGSKWGWFGW